MGMDKNLQFCQLHVGGVDKCFQNNYTTNCKAVKSLKELKKISKKLTLRLIVTGVALAGIVLLAANSDKLIALIAKPEE